MLAAVPIIFLIVDGSTAALWFALGLMVVAEVSDGVDGYVARRFGQVSALGKILDPMADSLYRIAVFTAFVANQWMPVWMLVAMASREVAMSYLRIYAESRVGTLAARNSGKIKAVFQGAIQIAVVSAYALAGGDLTADIKTAIWAVLLVTTAISIGSFFDYIFAIAARERQLSVETPASELTMADPKP